MSIFEDTLESFIDISHEMVLLSNHIDWGAAESEFAEYCCADNGQPSVLIRKMAFSDGGVDARWLETPYMQYFSGEKVFQKRSPVFCSRGGRIGRL